MLLPVMTAKRNLIAALAALSIAAPAAPALAWGDKEQGFVAGVATAVIIDELLKNNRKARAYDRGHAAPVYVDDYPACRLVRERFWDGYGWRYRRIEVCN